MKNIFVLLIISVAFTACKKSYTCECTESYNGYNGNSEVKTDTTFADMEREEAETKCTDMNVGRSNLVMKNGELIVN